MDDTTGPGLPALRPALNFAPELLMRAQGVKVAFFDVDGVLTDGGLYFSEHGPQHATQSPGQLYAAGETIKRFSTLDGHGLKMLQKAGITPVIITGRDSVVLRARLHALGITHAHFGTEDKRPAADEILADVRVKRGTQKWQGGFVEAPLVYLRGKRWEDGVEPEAAAERGEILGIEGHGRDGIAGIGVEASRDEDEVGLERDHGVE